MSHAFNILSSTLASTLRSWKGTSSSKKSKQPALDIILFDQEGCSECRLVREALTALNLNVVIAPCPIGGNNIRQLKQDSGSDQLPRLVDANNESNLLGSEAIVNFLNKEYRGNVTEKSRHFNTINKTASKIASLVRFNAGTKAKPARTAEKSLTLYSFESSPYSRPVRELLCELELPYLLVNLGKQQWSDMGPANFRFTLKPYQPIKNTKRDAFFQLHGDVQVPFLSDPNTRTELFESKAILNYLMHTYQK